VRQVDGKLVVGGDGGHAPDFVIWLARVGTDWMLDGSFGTDGIVQRFVSIHGAALHDLVVEPVGTLLVGTTVTTGEGGQASALTRFTAAGGADGGVSVDLAAPHVAVGPNRTVVAAETSRTTARIAVTRFSTDLSVDASFAGGTAAGPVDSESGDLVVQPDGKVDVGGSHFAVVRFTAVGVVDAEFGSDGAATVFRNEAGFVSHLVHQDDGKLVAAGTVGDLNAGTARLAVVRLLGDALPGTVPGATTTTTVLPVPRTTTTTVVPIPGTTTTTVPGVGGCLAGDACDDGDPCTADRCEAGQRVHEPGDGFAGISCLCGLPVPRVRSARGDDRRWARRASVRRARRRRASPTRRVEQLAARVRALR
jgi:beta-propeller uncharacterized protein DUF5122